jgi:hypothetical protein
VRYYIQTHNQPYLKRSRLRFALKVTCHSQTTSPHCGDNSDLTQRGQGLG